MEPFVEFPKMARLRRNIVVTEKIDGTNSQVFVSDMAEPECLFMLAEKDGLFLYAGSRTRWLTIKEDNYGFAQWCRDNSDSLFKLGVGRHYGEWWGQGIQRNYGLDHKRFSLFNTGRWDKFTTPECCHVVPVLYMGMFDTEEIDLAINGLINLGSVASPGFLKPEGIVIYHIAANQGFKQTIEKDHIPKSMIKE